MEDFQENDLAAETTPEFVIDDYSREILEGLPVSLIVMDPKKIANKIVLASQGFCSMLGFTLEEFWHIYLTRPAFLVHPQDIAKVGMIQHYAATHPGQDTTGIIRLRTKTADKYKWIYGTGHGKKDANGNLFYYITCADVSESWEYHAAASKSTLHLGSLVQNIMDTAGSAIFWKDIDSRFIGANRAFLDMAGLELDEIIGQTAEELQLVQPGSAAIIPDAEILAGNTCKHRQGEVITCQGEKRTVIMSKTPLKSGEQIVGVVGSFEDITDYLQQRDTIGQLKNVQKAYHTVASGAGLVVWHYDFATGEMELLDNEVSSHVEKKFLLPHCLKDGPEHFEHFLAEESLEDFRQLHAKLRRGESGSCDVRFKQFPGQPPHWERLIYSVVSEDGSMPKGAYGLGMDVTAECLRRQQYNKELELLHTASQTNLLAKYHVDLSENRVIDYVAQSAHGLTIRKDMSYSMLRNTLLELIIDTDERQMVSRELNQDHLVHQFVAGERNFSLEYHRHCDDLSPIMVECSISLFSGSSGHIECFLNFYDITNKYISHIIADKLSELGYSQVCLINTLTGTMTYFSKRTGVVESSLDKPLFYEDVVFAQVSSVLHEEEAVNELCFQLSLDNIISQLDEQPMYDISFDFPGPDGNMRRKRVQACYLDKGHTSIFLIQSDVTPQYQMERRRLAELEAAILEADKANESKAIFLSGISHDMRTPLNGILSFTNFALNAQTPEKCQEYLKKIRQSGKLLLSLINDTLNLTRIESGKVSVNRELVDAKELLDEIVTGIASAAEEKDITLSILVDEDLPANLILDKLKIQEIYLNLLSNAVKFTKPGGHIDLMYERLAEADLTDTEREAITGPNHGWARAVVADTGIGMSEAFLPKVFEAFAQEESQEIKNPNGTGLGLSIVKKYVDMLGGSIRVTSKLGKGTTFELRMPYEEGRGGQTAESPEVESFDFSNLHVLLVEDNVLNQEIATMLLQSQGATLDIANNGQEAVDTFLNTPEGTYQLILMDIRMPILNGYGATERIRHSHHQDAQRIPIIAMTADAYDEDVQKCLRCGMNSHISKPINPDRLYKEIAKYCGNRQA